MSNEATSFKNVSRNQWLNRLEREMIHQDALKMMAFWRPLSGQSEGNVESDLIAKVNTSVEQPDLIPRSIVSEHSVTNKGTQRKTG